MLQNATSRTPLSVSLPKQSFFKKHLQSNYNTSYSAAPYRCNNAQNQAHDSGTPDYGSAMESWRLIGAGNPGCISGAKASGVHDSATVVYRLEAKKAIRIAKKVGNANVFEPVISRTVAGNSLIDDLLGFFGGRVEPVIARLIESGKLTMEDIKEAEEALRSLSRKDKRK